MLNIVSCVGALSVCAVRSLYSRASDVWTSIVLTSMEERAACTGLFSAITSYPSSAGMLRMNSGTHSNMVSPQGSRLPYCVSERVSLHLREKHRQNTQTDTEAVPSIPEHGSSPIGTDSPGEDTRGGGAEEKCRRKVTSNRASSARMVSLLRGCCWRRDKTEYHAFGVHTARKLSRKSDPHWL